MKKKLYLKRAAAIGTAAVLACGVTACGTKEADTANAETQAEKEEELVETMNRITGSGQTTEADTDKEETVYVLADSEGEPAEIIVSEWLKNVSGEETIEDVTSLKEIKNVKGDEAYTDSSDGIVWESDGADIYYQGKSEKELPIGIKVTYYLDDKQVTPQELAGKSGHVRIRYEYINNSSSKVQINNEDTEVYTPFVMATGMMLPTDTFKNVTVSNGDVISEGNNIIAFGIGMPGLSESLGLENTDMLDLDFSVPDYFEVTADVEDFSLGMVVTLCSNTLIDMSEFEMGDSVDKLNDDMNTLTDGSNQLVDGSSQLYDGTSSLKDGTARLSDGVEELYTGVKSYADGVASAKTGAAQLAEGSESLDAGAGTLADKLTEAKNGSTQLKDGLNTLNTQAPALINGITAVQNALEQVLKGYEGEQNSTGAVAGAKAVAEGLAQLNQQVSALSLPDMSSHSSALTEEQKAAVEQQIKNYLANDENGKKALAQATENYMSSVNGLLSQNGIELDAQTSAVMEAVMKGTFEQAFINIYVSSYESGMEKGMGEVLTEVSSQLSDYTPAITQLQGAVSQLAQGSASVSDGISQLYEGTKKLDGGVDTMYESVKALPAGVNALYSGSASLENGLGQLESGAAALKNGTASLKGGATQLLNGCVTLNNAGSKLLNGLGDLKTGVSDLSNGAGELQSGALELKDGIVQFNDEGINKLQSLVKEDLNHIADRIQAVSDVNEDYILYGGIADGKSGSEKFIIKIDGIEE